MSRPTPRWRRALSPILLVAAMLMLAVGQLALYATYNLFDSDRFADQAVTALERIRDRLPNLVAVDFYAEGDVTGVVDQLNGLTDP